MTPDAILRRTMKAVHVDLDKLTEDEQITVIGEAAQVSVVGALLQMSEPKMIWRFICKIRERYPAARHYITLANTPIAGIATVKFGPRDMAKAKAMAMRK